METPLPKARPPPPRPKAAAPPPRPRTMTVAPPRPAAKSTDTPVKTNSDVLERVLKKDADAGFGEWEEVVTEPEIRQPETFTENEPLSPHPDYTFLDPLNDLRDPDDRKRVYSVIKSEGSERSLFSQTKKKPVSRKRPED
jgi:hypothetical protein